MKVANFCTYTLIFCVAWLGLAVWGWGAAQSFSTMVLMPWVFPIVKLWPTTVAFALGGAVSVLGAFVAAMVLLVVLFALEALMHHLQGPSTTIPR